MSIVETLPDTFIHPHAEVDATATIADGVRIGSGAIVGPRCVIGAGTRIREKAIIVQDTTIGERNDVHPFAVIGGDPQDRAYAEGDACHLHIGDDNVFREFVTVSRGTSGGEPTRIGNRCMLMAHAHIGHNCQMHDDVVLANSASIAGHAIIGERCVLSGFVTVHQFCEVGEGVMFHVHTAVGKHVPPFMLVMNNNVVNGLNVKGLARFPGATTGDRTELKELYRVLFREREIPLSEAVAEVASGELGPFAHRFVQFIERAMGQDGARARGVVGAIVKPAQGGGTRLERGYDDGFDGDDPMQDKRA
ncbi:MAG: acyl-ACP--UDP-N-acetylglucosamine O-acyltransferase [Planctomycetota bacterium]